MMQMLYPNKKSPYTTSCNIGKKMNYVYSYTSHTPPGQNYSTQQDNEYFNPNTTSHVQAYKQQTIPDVNINDFNHPMTNSNIWDNQDAWENTLHQSSRPRKTRNIPRQNSILRQNNNLIHNNMIQPQRVLQRRRIVKQRQISLGSIMGKKGGCTACGR